MRVGEERNAVLRDIIETYDIATLVTEDHSQSGIKSILGMEDFDGIGVADCDTVIVTRIEHLETVDSVVVPVGRGPHSGMAVDIGLAIARQNDARLDLLHVVSGEDGHTDGDEVLERAVERVGDYPNAQRTLREAGAVADEIIEYAKPYDITVLGAPREGRLRQFILGTIPEEVSARAEGTVVTAHRGGTDTSWLANYF